MATYHHWTVGQALALFDKPLLELLFEAQQVHRQHFDPRQVQVSTLLSIKTGKIPTRGICLIWRKWLKASRLWGWKPV